MCRAFEGPLDEENFAEGQSVLVKLMMNEYAQKIQTDDSAHIYHANPSLEEIWLLIQ